jgi:DNA-binding NtrC family response regulator
VPDLLAELIGECPEIGAVRDRARRLLASERPNQPPPSVLIEGPAGTGKSLLAWLIHASGVRAANPFVAIDCCDGHPAELLDAELFGHAAGCFCCDGQRGRSCLLEEAHRGTLFLDGVEGLPAVVQARLVRVLENRQTVRFGETGSRDVDIRFISATRIDLDRIVDQGRFRKELYDRLADVTFTLPAVRSRGRDVVLLAARLLERACRAAVVPVKRLAADAEARILRAPASLRARDLADVLERIAQTTLEPVVTAAMLTAAGFPGDGASR